MFSLDSFGATATSGFIPVERCSIIQQTLGHGPPLRRRKADGGARKNYPSGMITAPLAQGQWWHAWEMKEVIPTVEGI